MRIVFMERHKSTPISPLLDMWLRSEGLETPLLQHRLVSGWGEVMGPAIEKYTGEIRIQGTRLNVQIKSPALRNNLMMMRSEICRKMNEYVRSQIITDVMFY